MAVDIFKIDIPKFPVVYLKNHEYSYTRKKGRDNLFDVLYQASHGYCMYCYNRIQIDDRRYGHLEHAIEKNISTIKLTDCIPNIGLACSICNGKYKRKNEKKRRPDSSIIKQFEQNAECSENCTAECKAYKELKKAYLTQQSAFVILQPSGVIGSETGLELMLQYDALETKFIPNSSYCYSIKEIKFIEGHINLFHLNVKTSKTKQLLKFIEDTIEHDGHYSKLPYNNFIVELFIEQILKGMTSSDILKICELIYSISVLKFNT